jgi:hypothetical protein
VIGGGGGGGGRVRADVRITGVRSFVERAAGRLGRPGPVDAAEVAEVGEAIGRASRRVEQSIQRDRIGPERLTAATRDHRAWLAWFSGAEAFAGYVDAVGRVRDAVTAADAAGRSLAIRFLPIRHIYKLRAPRGGVGGGGGRRSTLTLPTPMTTFDAAGFADLAAMIFRREAGAKPRVVELMRSEAYAGLMTELEALGGVVDATRGAAHALAESFDRVNAAYFGGQMPRPRLTWSRGLTRRKFGHYDHVRDQVMVSSTLDAAAVPPFVVDYLMFHELLHKRHGVRYVNDRGMAHTREFYADERRFGRYAEADAWLMRLATGAVADRRAERGSGEIRRR